VCGAYCDLHRSAGFLDLARDRGATHLRSCRPLLEDCNWLGCGLFRLLLLLQDDCSTSGYTSGRGERLALSFTWRRLRSRCLIIRDLHRASTITTNHSWWTWFTFAVEESFATALSHSDRWTETALRRWLTANALHDRHKLALDLSLVQIDFATDGMLL
jgi:hypothetical protein